MADEPGSGKPGTEGSTDGSTAPLRTEEENEFRDRMTRMTVSPELDNPEKRKKWKLEDDQQRGPYLVELNVQHVGGLPGAAEEFLKLYKELFGLTAATGPTDPDSSLYEDSEHEPARIGKGYYRCFFK